jgi:hypothetical protein
MPRNGANSWRKLGILVSTFKVGENNLAIPDIASCTFAVLGSRDEAEAIALQCRYADVYHKPFV